MEKFLEKLKDWFGDMAFEYVVLKEEPDRCIFLTVSEAYKSTERNIEVYRVFKLGDGVEISQDLNYVVSLERDSSIATVISEVVRTYERVAR